MAITAQLIRNQEYRFALSEGENGWEGERNYLVNTDLEDLALLAEGLPEYGDSWGDGELAECRVYKRGPAVREGGRDATGTGGGGGWCRVPILYRSPTGSSFAVPTLTRAWTELRSVSGTINAKYPIGDDEARMRMLASAAPPATPNQSAIPPFAKIGNGDGATVYVGGVEARVHRWIDASANYDFARLINLTRPAKLNAQPINLPRINDMPVGMTVGAEQALYTSFETVRNGIYLEIIHVLQLAEHWRVVWQVENERGEGLPRWYHDQVYTAADFSGLWP